MNENPLLLEMHWMKQYRGTFMLKSKDYSKPVKMKAITDAVTFIAELFHLANSIQGGADQNGHFALANASGAKQWILHYRHANDFVALVVMVKDSNLPTGSKNLFVWEGNRQEFLDSVASLKFHLEEYPFWVEDRLEALTNKWSDWVRDKLFQENLRYAD